MLIFHSPKSNILLSTGDQFVRFYWTKLDREYIKIADLFRQQLWFSTDLYLADIKH